MIFEAYEQFELDIVMLESELTNYSNSTQLILNRIRVFYKSSSSNKHKNALFYTIQDPIECNTTILIEKKKKRKSLSLSLSLYIYI